MATVNEISRAESWLFQTLQTLIAGRCYSAVAPAASTYPLIVFTSTAGSDLMGVGPARIWASLIYVVKVTTQGTSYGPIASLADAVDAALHAASGTVSNGRILVCTRESTLALTEEVDGTQFRTLGGTYRLLVQPA